MSLITIDDDSSEEAAVLSFAGDKDVDEKNSSEESMDSKSKSSADSSDTEDLEDDTSNCKSNDTDLTLPIQAEGTDDSMAVDNSENNDETNEKPILELMKHLINYNGKQNTMLTNAELIKMLKNEFLVDVARSPPISVEIYMNVLKKFLKEWPQWDEFDRVMHESRCMDDNEKIEVMLEQKYTALREYLATMLKACRPFARESAHRMKQMAEIPSSTPAVPGDVSLEVNCTRSQLNMLFFRKPNPNLNNTIFNIDNSLPSKISLATPSLKSILNSSHVRLTVNTKCFKYKRELIHDVTHKLVNKKNQQQLGDNKLNVHLQTPKMMPKRDKMLTRKDVKAINKIVFAQRHSNPILETIFQVINDDISVLRGDFSIPIIFRHYMNPYKYVRYLYEDVDVASDKYDLQLEEMLSPRLKFVITDVCSKSTADTSNPNWLKFECLLCEMTFIGLEGAGPLVDHFRDNHQDEPDFMCMNCDEKFSVCQLGLTRWYHMCESDVIQDGSDTE